MTLPYIEIWDKVLLQLARVLDDARWTINNYSAARVELCEKIISTIQPLVHYATYIDTHNLGMCMHIINIMLLCIPMSFVKRAYSYQHLLFSGNK